METEKDPGTGGKKLSKSDSEAQLEARNKSYNKVLDLQATYIHRVKSGHFDEIPNALFRWKSKAEWHEKEFGW
jgi:hypothetical protein